MYICMYIHTYICNVCIIRMYSTHVVCTMHVCVFVVYVCLCVFACVCMYISIQTRYSTGDLGSITNFPRDLLTFVVHHCQCVCPHCKYMCIRMHMYVYTMGTCAYVSVSVFSLSTDC